MSEVTSVNSKTGEVVLKATDVEAVPESEAGQPGGVATLNGSGELPEAQLPSSVVTSSPKLLGEVEGLTKLVGSEGTIFSATLKGATEFEVVPLHEPQLIELLLTPGKYTWKVKSASWVGSEPEFGEGRALITILCWKGEVLLVAGTEGRKGEPGTNGNTVRNGTTAPEESLGANGDFYIKTVGGAPTEIYGPKASGKWPAGTSLKGEKGATGEAGPSGGSAIGVDAYMKIAIPIYARGNPAPIGEEVIGGAFKAVFARVVVPTSGHLHDIAVYNGATVNGNHNVALFDTGTAKAGEYTLLWESGSVEAKGEKAWQVIGDPNHEVTAGEQLLLAIMNSGTTHKFGDCGTITNNITAWELPAKYLPLASENLPKLCAKHTYSELKYKTLTEAQMEVGDLNIMILGRIA
jgi:hypothetical protein